MTAQFMFSFVLHIIQCKSKVTLRSTALTSELKLLTQIFSKTRTRVEDLCCSNR